MQPSEAEFFGSAGSVGVEEVGLVDVDLIINAIHKVRVDGLLQVLQGLEVGDLAEPDEIVIEEVYPAGGPALELVDPDPDGFGVDACEVNGGHAGGDG